MRLTIVLPSTGAFDSRTYRLARDVAARGHDVTVLARAAAGATAPFAAEIAALPGVTYVPLPVDRLTLVPRPLRALARRLGRAAGRLLPASLTRTAGVALDVAAQGRAANGLAQPADIWHAMGLLALPVALDLRHRYGGRVVYDSREIYLEARNLATLPRRLRVVVGAWERNRAVSADALLTVNEACRRMLRRRFGRDLAVAYNCPDIPDRPTPRGRRFHERLDVSPDTRIVLYHGGLSPGRGIEQLIEAIDLVPNAILVVMGYGELEAFLRACLAERPSAPVRLLPAVPPADLLGWVASADVAAMPIQPTTRNHRISTPNKLFEAMTVGTPVLASDMPGMRPIVRAAGCGGLVDPRDPRAIAAGLVELLDASPERRVAMGAGGMAAIREHYGWARQVEVILSVYAGLTSSAW